MNYNYQGNDTHPEFGDASNLSSNRVHTHSKKNLKIESYLSDALRTSLLKEDGKT